MDQTSREALAAKILESWQQNNPGIAQGVTPAQLTICLTQYDIDHNPPPTLLLFATAPQCFPNSN